MPELLIAAGGVFAALPPSVVALALADLVRRLGVSQLAVDQARLLGPLGAVEDEQERRQLLANLADDILLPLGGLILPAGIKVGRSAGRLRLKGASAASETELHPGTVEVVDLRARPCCQGGPRLPRRRQTRRPRPPLLRRSERGAMRSARGPARHPDARLRQARLPAIRPRGLAARHVARGR